WGVGSSPLRTEERARRIVEEAAALAEASAWPGPSAVHDIEVALGAKQRVGLSELAQPEEIDLAVRTWERPGQLQPMVRALSELRGQGIPIVLSAEGSGSLERSREVVSER